MSNGLKWFLGIIGVIVLCLGVLMFQIRFHDGPIGIISGGPFKTGELTAPAEDWTFIDEQLTVEMQTMIPPRSRTMWLVVADKKLYMVSAYMKTRFGKVWKKWPRTLDQDNRAIIRSDGKLYELQLERITDPAEAVAPLKRFAEKYGTPYDEGVIEDGRTWLYELKARS